MLRAVLVTLCCNYKLQKEMTYLEFMQLWMTTKALSKFSCSFPNLHNFFILFCLHLELNTIIIPVVQIFNIFEKES